MGDAAGQGCEADWVYVSAGGSGDRLGEWACAGHPQAHRGALSLNHAVQACVRACFTQGTKAERGRLPQVPRRCGRHGRAGGQNWLLSHMLVYWFLPTARGLAIDGRAGRRREAARPTTRILARFP